MLFKNLFFLLFLAISLNGIKGFEKDTKDARANDRWGRDDSNCSIFRDCISCSESRMKSSGTIKCTWKNGRCRTDNSKDNSNKLGWIDAFKSCQSSRECLNKYSKNGEEVVISGNRNEMRTTYCKWDEDLKKTKLYFKVEIEEIPPDDKLSLVLAVEEKSNKSKKDSKTVQFAIDLAEAKGEFDYDNVKSYSIHYFSKPSPFSPSFRISVKDTEFKEESEKIKKDEKKERIDKIKNRFNLGLSIFVGILGGILFLTGLIIFIRCCKKKGYCKKSESRLPQHREIREVRVNREVRDNEQGIDLNRISFDIIYRNPNRERAVNQIRSSSAINDEFENVGSQMNNEDSKLSSPDDKYFFSQNNKYEVLSYTSDLNIFGGNCTICLSNFSVGDKVVPVFCGHLFHLACLKRKDAVNSAIQYTCPNCKEKY